MNLSTAQILTEIRNGFYGFESQRLQIGTDEVKIWIRYDKEDRNSVYDLENMRINIINNNYIVSDLVDIKIERDLLSIDHLNGKRSVQIDADLSHDPNDIPTMLKSMHKYDVVIGSRYIRGINVVNWPISRLILSYMANVYVKLITGMKINDSTSGFKCISAEVLKKINLQKIKSQGYSFQIEVNFLAFVNGFKIKEIPIIFHDRTVGESKMSKSIIFEAIFMVPKLALKKFFRLW